MFTGPQVVSLLLGFFSVILAVWGVLWKLQGDLKADLHEALDTQRDALQAVTVSHENNTKECRQQFANINEHFTKIALQISTILEGDVRELKARVSRLESGQDEWTKTLRQRTHDLGTYVNKLELEVELIKRDMRQHPPPAATS